MIFCRYSPCVYDATTRWWSGFRPFTTMTGIVPDLIIVDYSVRIRWASRKSDGSYHLLYEYKSPAAQMDTARRFIKRHEVLSTLVTGVRRKVARFDHGHGFFVFYLACARVSVLHHDPEYRLTTNPIASYDDRDSWMAGSICQRCAVRQSDHVPLFFNPLTSSVQICGRSSWRVCGESWVGPVFDVLHRAITLEGVVSEICRKGAPGPISVS